METVLEGIWWASMDLPRRFRMVLSSRRKRVKPAEVMAVMVVAVIDDVTIGDMVVVVVAPTCVAVADGPGDGPRPHIELQQGGGAQEHAQGVDVVD
jgi:hypothetical protein